MGWNYLGLLCALCCWLQPAWAAEARVGDLALAYAAPWERASVEEEEAQKSTILRWKERDLPITVFLPMHDVDLKVEPARFKQQLQMKWRAQYGPYASIAPQQIAGTEWLTCRRPSLEGDAVVFHMVALRDGRVHHLLTVAPRRHEALPEPVHALLKTAEWRKVSSLVFVGRDAEREPSVPITLPAKPETATEAPAKAEAAPAAPPSAAPANAMPPKAGQWRLRRVVHSLPNREAMQALADAEGRRLGEQGAVTGYGLQSLEHGVKGFLEGFSWRRTARGQELKSPFARHWKLAWQPPPESWTAGEAWHGRLRFDVAASSRAGDAAFAARLELLAVCGEHQALIALFNALELGAASAELQAKACRTGIEAPAAVPVEAGAEALEREAARPLEREADIPLPQAWDAAIREAADQGGVARLILRFEFSIPEDRDALGNIFWQPVKAYYIYTPEP